MADNKAELILDGDVSPLRRKLREAVSDLNKFGQDGKKSVDGLGDAFGGLHSRMVNSLTGILSLGAIALFVKSTKDAALQAEASFRGLESVANFAGVGIGRAMEEASKLASDGMLTVAESSKALQNLLSRGYNIDQAVETLNRLKDSAAFNRQASLAMGEAVVGATEGLKNENSMLVDNAGVTKNVSKMWEEFARTHGIAVTSMTLGQKIAAEYNGIQAETEAQVGNAAKAMDGMQGATARMNVATDNLQISVGQALTPAFAALAQSGTWMIETFAKPMVWFIQAMGVGVATTATQLGIWWDAITSWNFSGMKEKFAAARALQREMLQDLAADLNNPMGTFTPSGGTGNTADPNRLNKGGKDPAAKKAKSAKTEKSVMGDLSNDLASLQSVNTAMAAEQGRFYTMSKDEERQYWKDILATRTLGAKDTEAILRKIADLSTGISTDGLSDRLSSLQQEQDAYSTNLEAKRGLVEQELAMHEAGTDGYKRVKAKLIDIDRAAADQSKRIAALRADAVQQELMRGLDAELAVARQLLDLGSITKAQFLEMEAGFNQRRLDSELAFIAQKIEIAKLDPDSDLAQLEALELAKLEIRSRYAAQAMDIQRKQALESQGIWTSLTGVIESLWDKGIQALMNGTLTWSNAMRAIGADVTGWFVTNVVGKMVKEFLAGEAAKIAGKMGWVAIEKALNLMSAKTTIGTKGTETTAVAGMNAVQAGTGAAASQASIPYIGPILALAAMAAIFAAVSSMGKKKSAMGGYDIPKGLNPMTQLHEEEMVLPKKYANAIRNMAGGGAGGNAVNLTMNIQTRDADSFRASQDQISADMHSSLASLSRGV